MSRNGATKGIISPTSTTTDQLNGHIIALLEPLPSTPGKHPIRHTDSVDATPDRTTGENQGYTSSPPSSPPVAQQSSGDAGPSTSLEILHREPSELGPQPRSNRKEESGTGESGGQEVGTGKTPETVATEEASTQSPIPAVASEPVQDWRRKQRDREEGQRKERERIKEQIRQDHEERRQRAWPRSQATVLAVDHDSSDHVKAVPHQPVDCEVRIQVRTFDGSTIRSKFPGNATISAQIRPWIQEVFDQHLPYNLKVMLGPLANRAIELAEEEKSLEDLDLVGSCTLVMVPVKGYVDSYTHPGSGIVYSVLSGGYQLLSGSLGAVYNGIGSVFHGNRPADREAHGPSDVGTLGRARIRTLADQRMEEQEKDPQFYNGNRLDFEPRKDDDEGGKD